MVRGLGAALAILKNDLRLNLVRPFATLISLVVPINFLILFVLFAIGGARVPVGVVAAGSGHYGTGMVQSLGSALTFRMQGVPSVQAGMALIQAHHSVATIQVPPDFSARISHGQPAHLAVILNNLNHDFADDVRRALPLAILNFYHTNFPQTLPLHWREIDSYPHNVSFIGYLAVSVQTVALLIGGLLFGGRGAARDWERGTIKELMLAPIPPWSIVLGKLAAGMVNGLVSAGLILVVLLLLGLQPLAWGQLIGVMVITLLVFVGLGVALGSLVKSQFIVTPFAFALGLPLFFISGAFGPISWSTPAAAMIARVFPVVYANAAFQHAVHGYWPIDTSPFWLWIILAVWAAAALATSWIVYRRATTAH